RIEIGGCVLCPNCAQGTPGGTRVRVGLGYVGVPRNLGWRQSHRLYASSFTDDEALTLVHGQAALQIRKRERLLTIATVGSAHQGKKTIVLRNRQYSSIAERPSDWSKVACEHPYLTDIWTRHRLILLSA